MKKQTFKMLLACCLLGVCGGSVRAQSVGPSILNSAGSAAVISSNTYEWSVGEVAVVTTAVAPGIIVTQGLLQPSSATTAVATAAIPDQQLNVFPVPATTILNIQPAFASGGTLHLSLVDIAGRVLVADEISLASGQELQQLNIGSYALGNYILNLAYETQGVSQQRSYKIQKIQ